MSFLRGPYPKVVATVALWSGSIDDAADAVADALGRAWEKIDHGQSVDNLAAFRHDRGDETDCAPRLTAAPCSVASVTCSRSSIRSNPTDASIRRLDVAAALESLTPVSAR